MSTASLRTAMTDDEIVEIVGRGLCVENGYDPDRHDSDMDGPQWLVWRDDARAALAALRKAGCEVVPALDFDTDWFVVSEAINDAYSDGEGRLSEGILKRLFAHHGLVVAHTTGPEKHNG